MSGETKTNMCLFSLRAVWYSRYVAVMFPSINLELAPDFLLINKIKTSLDLTTLRQCSSVSVSQVPKSPVSKIGTSCPLFSNCSFIIFL
jgi:hypothetical protein